MMTRLPNPKQAISHPKEKRKLFLTEIPSREKYIQLIRTNFSIVILSLLLSNCTLARL